jgi:hypothetical protein
MTMRALGDLVDVTRESQNPARLDGKLVQHFSIPAFDRGAEAECVRADTIRSGKLRLRDSAVLVSKINPHIPRCWLADPMPDLPALASTEFLALIPKSDAIDLGYLYAVCSSRPFQRTLMTLVTGTSSSHQRVKPRDLLSVEIPVARRDDQVRIGTEFRSLIRRHRVAREIGALANDLINATFREYFGPGAGSRRLGEVAGVTFGVSYRSAELNGAHQALVTLKCFGRTGDYRADGLKPWSGEAKSAQLLEAGDVVVAQTDLTQAADVLGRAVLVRGSRTFDRLVASLDVAVVRPDTGVNREYIYGLLIQPEFRRYCRSRSNGTTVLHLSRKALPEYEVFVPDSQSLDDYTARVRPIMSRMLLVDDEVQVVQQLRESFISSTFGA